jgi:hypothetical protein
VAEQRPPPPPPPYEPSLRAAAIVPRSLEKARLNG